MTRTSMAVLLLFSAMACSAEGRPPPGASRPGAMPPSTGITPPLASPPVQRDRIVRASLQMVADDVGAAVDALRDEAEDRGGRVDSLRDARAEERASASLALRVPADALPSLRRAARGIGRITSDVETTDDVTGDRVDLDARVRNARAAEARLIALTEDRTSSLADVLTTERELARVRESIETMEASARTLADEIAMARVAIEIRAPAPPVVEAPSFADDPVATIGASFGAGARFTYVAGIGVLAVVATALPPATALVLLALLAHLVRTALRRVS